MKNEILLERENSFWNRFGIYPTMTSLVITDSPVQPTHLFSKILSTITHIFYAEDSYLLTGQFCFYWGLTIPVDQRQINSRLRRILIYIKVAIHSQ